MTTWQRNEPTEETPWSESAKSRHNPCATAVALGGAPGLSRTGAEPSKRGGSGFAPAKSETRCRIWITAGAGRRALADDGDRLPRGRGRGGPFPQSADPRRRGYGSTP
jgi:hypothetical protein